MASPPNPDSQGSWASQNAAIEDPSLEAGLAALKQGDYLIAIAHLEGICEIELDPPTVSQAQMNLVEAYEHSAPQKAIALCQELTQSEDTEVKDWAVSKLAELTGRYPQEIYSPVTKAKARPAANSAQIVNPAADPTGFVPFNSPPLEDGGQQAAENQPDPSGFVPFDSPPQKRRSLDGETSEPLHPHPLSPLPKGEGVRRQGGSKKAASDPSQSAAKPPAVGEVSQQPSAKGRSANSPPPSVGEGSPRFERESRKAQSKIPPPLPPIKEGPTSLLSGKIVRRRKWRQAGRAQKWQPMKAVKPSRLWWAMIGTAIALFWIVRAGLNFVMATTNNLLVELPVVEPIQAFYRDQTYPLICALLLLLGASPWILDKLLQRFYGLQPLSLKTLSGHSPEAAKLLQRFSVQRKQRLLTLAVLPTDAPVAMTYGSLPRFARIVVSQGLLEQLSDDEIAAIIAGELGHIIHWDFALMSLAILLCQIPYIVYWQVALEGEKWENQKTWREKLMLSAAAGISSLGYCIYWVLRWPVLWLSRLRVYYSDRVSASWTGNPNGLTRALLKMAFGIAEDIEKNGRTSWILEGFDLLTPMGTFQAISLGSCSALSPIESKLEWDCTNPYRRWLAINNSHPPTGDRLHLLDVYARFWKLETELDLETSSLGQKFNNQSQTPNLQRLLLQGAPYFGLPIGLAMGISMWLIGGIMSKVGIWQMDWVWGDRWLLLGSLPIGVSLGIFSRINYFFPDITPQNLQTDRHLTELLGNPEAIPLDSQPIRLTGKLLGRRGISNWLGQDLILRSPSGLVKLHCFSQMGPIGNLWPQSTRPSDLIDSSIAATGWFRRGSTPWIDIETLVSEDGRTSRSGHPVWSTILACAAAAWGAYLISRGGL